MMRVPEATKQGYCEILRGGAWIWHNSIQRLGEDEK